MSQSENSSPATPTREPIYKAGHLDVKEAVKAKRQIAFFLDDDGFSERIGIGFHDAGGRQRAYRSEPLKGRTPQAIAEDAAKKLLRLGIPRDGVKLFIERNIPSGSLDWTKIFQVQMRKPKEDRVVKLAEFAAKQHDPRAVAEAEAQIAANGFALFTRRGMPFNLKVVT